LIGTPTVGLLMAWKIDVRLDKDQNNVGTVVGTWNDLTYGMFTYTKRVKTDTGGASGYMTEAIAARDAWQLKQVDNTTKAAYLLNLMNTNDEQVEV